MIKAVSLYCYRKLLFNLSLYKYKLFRIDLNVFKSNLVRLRNLDFGNKPLVIYNLNWRVSS